MIAFSDLVEIDDYYIFAEVYTNEWEGKPRCLPAALRYAARGWRVFPAPRGEKKSHKSAEYSDGRKWGATDDPAEIKRDFALWPEANLGIPTGAINGFWVLEADTKEGHSVDSIGSLRALEDQHGKLPATLTAESPSGSLHYYFQWPHRAIRNSTSAIAPGVDVRGEGGMVIASPSVKAGTQNGAYTWTSNLEPVDAPEWLVDIAVAASGGEFDGGDRQTNSELVAEHIEIVEAAVEAIPNPDLDWESWNVRGMAIFAATRGSNAGLAIFDRFSQKSPKYNAKNTLDKWRSYHSSPPNRIGMGSLVHWANEAKPGWLSEFDDRAAAEINAAGAAARSDPDIAARIDEAGAIVVERGIEPNIRDHGYLTADEAEHAVDAETEQERPSGGGNGQAATREPPPSAEARSGSGANGSGAQARADDQQRQQTGDTFPLVDIYGWDGVPVPEQEWAVEDRIPVGHTTLFSAEGAAGKSLIELQRCVAHALELDWLGVKARGGRALFVDAEDDDKIIHKRLHDILHYHGRTFAELKDKLYVSSLIGKSAILGVANRRSSRIEPTSLYKLLREMVGDIKPLTISIASSANVFAGSEIDRSQVQQFVSLLTRLAIVAGGGVVLISHPSLTGINSDSGLSGSTAWHNSVRARFYIKGVKAKDGEPEGNRRVIEFRKNNYGPISENIVVEYRNGLFLPLTGTTVDRAAREDQAEEVYLTVLKILINQNQDLSPTRNAPNYAPTVISQHPGSGTFRREEMEAAQQRLLDARKIHIEEVGPASRRRKHVVPGPGPAPGEEVM